MEPSSSVQFWHWDANGNLGDTGASLRHLGGRPGARCSVALLVHNRRATMPGRAGGRGPCTYTAEEQPARDSTESVIVTQPSKNRNKTQLKYSSPIPAPVITPLLTMVVAGTLLQASPSVGGVLKRWQVPLTTSNTLFIYFMFLKWLLSPFSLFCLWHLWALALKQMPAGCLEGRSVPG